MTSQHVFSSHVSHIAHDPATNEMTVTWRDGKRSIYSGVPAALAKDVANAPSVGTALRTQVKGRFDHRYA